VTDLLTAERIWWVRMNSRTVRMPGANGKDRPVFFGLPGMADILATPVIKGVARILWIETKAGKGKQRPDQINFEQWVKEAGHSYIVAYSSDDVLLALRSLWAVWE
jgi:hypothetical protein